MIEIKEQILKAIYNQFDNWNRNREKACLGGCAACCTQNVTVTATEAELIHKAILEAGKSDWLAEILVRERTSSKLIMTTNEFAGACLNGEAVDPGAADNYTPCLFLENGYCQVYEVRPFSCRAFISSTACSKDQPATMTEQYAAATTAVSQIIEHLGQKEYCGYLFDILTVMTENTTYQGAAKQLSPIRIMDCRLRTLTAQPLAGFLLTEEDMELVEPLLLSIFQTKIGNKTIKEILNGAA